MKNSKVYSKEGYCLSELDILYHMNADEQNEFQNDILKLIELSGVHVFNDYNSFAKCKDKVMANMILRNNDILVAPSMLINNNVNPNNQTGIITNFDTPNNIVNEQVNTYANDGYIEIEVIYEVLETIGVEQKIVF